MYYLATVTNRVDIVTSSHKIIPKLCIQNAHPATDLTYRMHTPAANLTFLP